MFTYFFFHRFSHTCSTDFFSCLWQNVYTILFSFSERAWAQFYWLPRPREHNRVGSGLALRGVFHKMHFHQWELKCTSAIFTMFKPRISVFIQWHRRIIVQQLNRNSNYLSVYLLTRSQYPLAIYEFRAVLLLVER